MFSGYNEPKFKHSYIKNIQNVEDWIDGYYSETIDSRDNNESLEVEFQGEKWEDLETVEESRFDKNSIVYQLVFNSTNLDICTGKFKKV